MKKTMTERRRAARAGFTLMEILVVLIIITVLAGIVGVNVMRHPGQARVAAAAAQVQNLKNAVKLYYAEQHNYPTQAQGLDALVAKPTTDPIPANYPQDGYLDTLVLPRDPWGHEFVYLIPGRHGESFEIISYGADGEPGGEGDNADISSSGAVDEK